MVKLINVLILLFILSGCENEMYKMLHRTADDPVIVRPNVESFVESNTIFINWEFDEGADEYILERALDTPDNLVFIIIYKGKALEYADRGLEDGARFIYRLSKRRGKVTFGPSKEALGVSSLVIRDIYRNDTMEQALKLESTDYIANIFYYRSYNGLELIDEDWYFIDIPPMRQASVVVRDYEANEPDSLTHFLYYEHARESYVVRQLRDFWIVNTELETKRCYFKIFPAKSQFVNSGIPAGGGIVQYKISLNSILPVQIGG